MKRILSAVLVVCLVLSMGVAAFAATVTYTGFYQTTSLQEGYNRQYNLLGTNKEVKNKTVDLGEIYASDKKTVLIGLYNTMFVDKNGQQGGVAGPVVPARLTQADIRASKFKVFTRYASGRAAIKKISLDSKNGQIQVELADEFVSTKPLDFEIFFYLEINGQRYDDRGFTVSGTMYNREVDVYKDYESIDISDQSIAVANDSVRNLEIEIGNGVTVTANLSRNQKYYGTATLEPTDDDEDVFAEYSSIRDVINIKTVGLDRAGSSVKLSSDWSGLYVYDEDFNYLGRSNAKLPFRTKYYLAGKQLSGTGSSGNTGNSGNTGSTGSDKPPVEVGSTLTKADATSLFKTALKAKPSSQKTLSIKAQNKTSVSLDTLKELQRLATNAKVTPTLVIDNTSGGSVQTRLSITPSKATKSINTLVSLDSANAKTVSNYFNKWFRNDLFVVSCEQEQSFGMTVKIAAKLPKNFKTSNLAFYSYDIASNSYKRITTPSYSVDSAGYVHFSTSMAGDIVISNGTLSK